MKPRPLSSRYRLLFAFGGIVLVAFSAFAIIRATSRDHSLFHYLSEQGIERMEIRMDLQSIYKKDSLYHPASLVWMEESGEKAEVPVEICARGKNRREVCEFPPLKVRTLPGKGHDFGKNAYKLVTHCLEGEGESLLLREYLAYQMYAALTEVSFQARLIRVTYTDTEGDAEPVESWALMLESKDDLLARLDAKDLAPDAPVREVSASEYNLFAVFQYMIGNTDWNLDKEHNVRLVSLAKGGSPVPVPYDFDRSGLVNASYAEPHFMLPIQEVRDRYFQWRGKDREQLEPVLDLIRQRKDTLTGLVWDLEALSLTERQDIISYLEEFFMHMDQLLLEGHRMQLRGQQQGGRC